MLGLVWEVVRVLPFVLTQAVRSHQLGHGNRRGHAQGDLAGERVINSLIT